MSLINRKRKTWVDTRRFLECETRDPHLDHVQSIRLSIKFLIKQKIIKHSFFRVNTFHLRN